MFQLLELLEHVGANVLVKDSRRLVGTDVKRGAFRLRTRTCCSMTIFCIRATGYSQSFATRTALWPFTGALAVIEC